MLLLLYIFIGLLCLWKIDFKAKGIFETYLSRDVTNSIKGVFILMVFVSHLYLYISASGYASTGIADKLFRIIRLAIGQFVVVMFLFYSGYGVSLSIISKGADYVKAMPRRRILTTLINFDVAVLVFAIVNLCIGQEMDLSKMALSFLAWDNIGNSNWYIFVILCCYIITYIVCSSLHSKKHIVIAHIVLTLVQIFVLSMVKEAWWCNTMLAYSAGYFFGSYKNQIETAIKRHYGVFLALFLALFLFADALSLMHRDFHYAVANIAAVLFAALVVTLSMKIRVSNPALSWCGKKLFPLYIYQRVPMLIIAFLSPSFIVTYPLAFSAITIGITLVIAYFYHHWEIKLVN